MRGIVIGVAGLVLLTACSVSSPTVTPQIKTDTPALRQLKADAHIQDCPVVATPATGALPNATLPCLGGGPAVNLASLRGPMVINVWAQYCGPCRAEMPHIQAFAQKYAGRVQVLGVDYVDTPALALGFAKEEGATYPLLADLSPVIRTGALPTTILIDANGRIAYQQPVAITSESELEQLVATHLGVTP